MARLETLAFALAVGRRINERGTSGFGARSRLGKQQRKGGALIDLKQGLRNAFARHEALCLGLGAFLLFMAGIWHQPFVNFETRFAVFAQEMLRNGPTLFPTTYGQPYPDYPVTSTVLIWLVSLPFGEVSKFTAVMPTALASALVIALTYKLFAQYSRPWAALAVCLEFLTLTFDAEARSISVDQMLSAVTLAAFHLTHKAYRDGRPAPAGALLALLVAGFLIRGPIGIVIPAGVVIAHLFLTAGRRQVIVFAAASAGVLLACSLALLGLAMLNYGTGFVADIVRMQALNRFSESTPYPIYYYFSSSFGNYALSYPLAVLVALSLLASSWRCGARRMSSEHKTLIVLLLAWVAIVLAGLSIPETKKARYILPVVPALAGLASYLFIISGNRLTDWLRNLVHAVLIALPLLGAVVVYSQRARVAQAGIDVQMVVAALSLLFLLGVGIALRKRLSRLDRSLRICALAAVTAYSFQVFVVEPVNLNVHDTSGFVRSVEALMAQTPGQLVFYKENPDGLPIKYLVNANADCKPVFIDDADAIKRIRSPVWLLTRDENVEHLRKDGIDVDSFIDHKNFANSQFSVIFVSPH